MGWSVSLPLVLSVEFYTASVNYLWNDDLSPGLQGPLYLAAIGRLIGIARQRERVVCKFCSDPESFKTTLSMQRQKQMVMMLLQYF